MRNHGQPTSSGIRSTIGSILLTAAALCLTWGITVPVCVLYAVALAAAYLLHRAYTARDRALAHALQQQRRADALTPPRASDTITALLHSGPRDQHVGHTDRDAVIDRLGDRYATGHLTADEFETRADEATRARTRGQLAHVLRDLP